MNVMWCVHFVYWSSVCCSFIGVVFVNFVLVIMFSCSLFRLFIVQLSRLLGCCWVVCVGIFCSWNVLCSFVPCLSVYCSFIRVVFVIFVRVAMLTCSLFRLLIVLLLSRLLGCCWVSSVGVGRFYFCNALCSFGSSWIIIFSNAFSIFV